MEDCFVLLDDCHATHASRSSRLYTGFAKQHVCTNPATLDAVWAQVEADMAQGLHAAVLVDYEWGAKLQKAGTRHLSAADGSAFRVLLFKHLAFFGSDEVAQWLAKQDGSDTPSPAGIANLAPSVSRAEFDAGVARILELIRAGETYQVNYTYRMQGQQFGSPLGLYRRLRELQPVAFGALVALGDQWVLSCSPELFVRNSGGQLITRPMKGTAPRGCGADDDAKRVHWLGRDPKNRAENVMIVDLLRNDLGRISEIGSVQVPQLFSVETYRTVHQMTSTVQSRIRPDVDMPGVLRALFPCGSITGTPKVNTMDWIAALESGPRGLYCGAIGWVDAPKAPALCGDFCLSVAIRTVTLGEPQDALRPATLGVGGGIVLDSVQGNEFEETLVKARFLTRIDPGLTLFETLLLHHGRLRNLNLHLARLESSADALGFRFDATQVKTELARYASALDPSFRHRVRLDLAHGGQVRLSHAVLDALPRGPVRLVLSGCPVPELERALLHHKTSLRSTYDQAIRDAANRGAFDAVFVNSRGEVTEGARSNVLVKLAGQWWTPPLSCGVLPGVMRTRLLRMRPAIRQKTLRVEDLMHAQELAVCSSLRGVLRAELLKPAL